MKQKTNIVGGDMNPEEPTVMNDQCEMDEPQIVSFNDAITVVPLTYEECTCKHMRIELTDAIRSVRCRDCGIDLAPYEYLRNYANGGFLFVTRIVKNQRALIDRLTAEIDELEKRKRNLKSSVRRFERIRVLDGAAE